MYDQMQAVIEQMIIAENSKFEYSSCQSPDLNRKNPTVVVTAETFMAVSRQNAIAPPTSGALLPDPLYNR